MHPYKTKFLDVLIGVCRWKHWSFGFMKQLFNNVKELFLIARALFHKR